MRGWWCFRMRPVRGPLDTKKQVYIYWSVHFRFMKLNKFKYIVEFVLHLVLFTDSVCVCVLSLIHI